MPLSKSLRSLSPFAKIKEYNEQREQMRKVKELDDKLETVEIGYRAIDAQIVTAQVLGSDVEYSVDQEATELTELAAQECKAMKEYEKLYPTLTGKARKECWQMINGIPDPNNKNQSVGGYVERLNLIKNNTSYLAKITRI